MAAQHFLQPGDFERVIRLTPLVSIDLIISDPEGQVLLGLRTNEPAKGVYFVPGGRIGKMETLDSAFLRILEGETGCKAQRSDAEFLGVYEHIYNTNVFGDSAYGTHYVVLGYRLQLQERPRAILDDQHSAWKWVSPVDLLTAHDVHENTKAYFR